MKKGIYCILTISIVVLFDSFSFAQVNMIADIPGRDISDPVYTYVEKMPVLKGGKETLEQYINYYPYPSCGLEKHIEGKVVLQFIVEKNGRLTDIQVLKSPNKCLSDAAVDYVSKWPEWQPAVVDGHSVSALFTLPIKYDIQQYNSREK
jgi:TonB family protein